MRIVNIASGSKGNCTYIEYDGTRVLIDVGLNEKYIQKQLEDIGSSLSEINAVCITHEHTDHIKALGQLAKKYNICFYIKRQLAESNMLGNVYFKNEKLIKFDNDTFCIGGLEIAPIELSHDAVAPVGFVIGVKNSNSKALFLTDTGFVPDEVIERLSGVKMAFIESNYDQELLDNGKYPIWLKERINSKVGHLSNEQALEFAKVLYSRGTKCFVLSHISQNNNTPELAYSNFAGYFEDLGLELDKDVFIRMSFQDKHGANFILKEEFDGK